MRSPEVTLASADDHDPGATSGTGRLASAVLAVGSLSALFLASRYSYLLFHTLAELVVIVVAVGVFVVAWPTRRLQSTGHLLFLGIAYLFVAGMDVAHTLAYKGMGVFVGIDANTPTQLWIAMRYLLSLTYLAAPLFLTRQVRPGRTFAIYGVVTGLLLASIFVWRVFPDCFVEGIGLTPFKLGSEYAISLIFAASLVLLHRAGRNLDARVLRLMSASIALSIASELAFTLYTDVYGILNMVGHLLMIVSFYLVYLAIIETGLSRPYSLLFRDLKAGADALRASEASYRTLVESTGEGVAVIDSATIVTYANPTAHRILGEQPGALVGKALSTYAADSQRLDAWNESNPLAVGNADARELVVQRHDGERRVLLVTARPRVEASGAATGAFLVFRDLTERLRAEEALRASESRYRRLVELSFDGIIAFDAAGRVAVANARIAAMLGRSITDLVGQPASSLSAGLPWNSGEAPASATGAPTADERELELRRPDGTTVPVRRRATPLLDDAGHVVGSFAVVYDLTEQRRADTIRLALEQHLAQAQKMEAIGSLAGGIAHDFNNLLGVVLGNTTLIEMDLPPNSPLRRSTEAIEQVCHRGAALTRQLLGFARRGAYELKPVDPALLLTEVADLMRRSLDRSIAVQVRFEAGLWPIIADQNQIHQVLMNLAINARDAMPQGGSLTFSAGNVTLDAESVRARPHLAPGRYVVVAVTDTGIGMTPDIMERAFDPFFTTKEVGKGTGLGLASAYGIVRNHGGHIEIESAVGQGTTMKVFVPAGAPESTEAATPEHDAPMPTGNTTLLVIDDELAVREFTSVLLTRLGYEVLLAADGREGVELYRKHQASIGLVILDMNMPVQGGAATARQLRAINTDCRIIVASGYSPDGEARDVLHTGNITFLQKPFRASVLARLVADMLAKAA